MEKPQSKQRLWTYIGLFGVLFLGSFMMRGFTWQGSVELHTLMEVITTFLALFVGVMALTRFYSKKNNTFLFIGTGFLGTGLLDGYHTLVTSSFFAAYFPSGLPSLIPWSWIASRVFLSILLWLSWLAWKREARMGEQGRIGEQKIYLLAGVLTLASFLFFAFVPLPRAYYPEIFFHRPEEFVPALFFLLALVGYLGKGRWRVDAFEHWLVLSLIVSFMGQAMYMSFSGQLFDMMFDAAHLLKNVSYVFVLTGLLMNTYELFRRAEEYSQTLEQKVEERTQELEHELKVAQTLLGEAKKRVEGPLLGESPAVRGLREAITRYAETDASLLVTGPRGAGHEAVARAIHHQSDRAKRAFIHVQCAVLQTSGQSSLFESVPPNAESSTLSKSGRFGLADGGTVYLDGVSELSPATQKQLTEVLREHQCQREAGQKPSPDVRVIASTSRDLAEESQGLNFNPALHQILSHGQLTVPGLAERREDIPVLVEYFLKQHARRVGKTVDGLTEESMKRLEVYRWPGNIRELENVIERAIVGADAPMLEIDESFLEGGVILDRYRLVEKLGAGGMGEVWLAKHQLLARPAAVKVIRPEALGNAQQRNSIVKRFQREAQTTASLSSPNTVRLYDFGISEDGSFYFVMELLNGINLESMVERFGPLEPERVIMLLKQACRSLSEAHAAGLVHRDIKPANLFICRMGREYDFLKVLDFGVVKRTIGGEETLLTGTDRIVGTPAYMAPDLILDGKEVDGRADLYALGCVAYWMLTGMLVFESDNPMQMMMHHANTKPTPPSSVAEVSIPKSLDELVLACLQKSPDDRPGSADEVWQMLGEVELGKPWTQERAEAWWQLHMPDLANSRTGTPAIPSS